MNELANIFNIPMTITAFVSAMFTIALALGLKKSTKYAKYGSTKFLVALTLLIWSAVLTSLDVLEGAGAAWMIGGVGCGYAPLNYAAKKTALGEDPNPLASYRKFIITTVAAYLVILLGINSKFTSEQIMICLGGLGTTFGLVNYKEKAIKG